MKTRRDFLKLAGAAIVGVSGVASAGENPFGFSKMDSGYAQVATEGKCGGDKKLQGSCGGNKAGLKQSESACGGNEKPKVTHSSDKEMEGSCGANKQPEATCGILKKLEGSCGAKSDPKVKEGKFSSQG